MGFGQQDNREQHQEHQHRHGHEPVYGITTAEESHTDDINRRQKQYIVTMLFRVVSVIVVVWVPGISWPIKILLCLVATVIPYVAVVRANGGPTQAQDPTNLLLNPPEKDAIAGERPGLEAGEPLWRAQRSAQDGEDVFEAGPAQEPPQPDPANAAQHTRHHRRHGA